MGSSISRETHAGSYTHAGPEIGVASTKAFTAQVTVLAQMALLLGKHRGSINRARYSRLLVELESIPEKVEQALESDALIQHIADVYKDASDTTSRRGYNFPAALEGALTERDFISTLKDILLLKKHGLIALIDEEMPVFVIATQDASYEKVVSNIQEVKARKGIVVAIVTKGDTVVKGIADHVIEIPRCDDALVPLIATIPLQLLSYHIAVMRGCNVDQPRNLAKSVTVE